MVRQTEVGSACDHEITYTYDDRNNLVTMKETRNGRSHVNTYTYDQNNRLTQIGYGVASKVFGYDSYGRLTDRDVKYNSNLVFEENYTYKTNPDGTPTGQIAAWQNENTKYDVTYSYSYDANDILYEICKKLQKPS